MMGKTIGEILLAVVCLQVWGVDTAFFTPAFVAAAAPQFRGYDFQQAPARLPVAPAKDLVPIKTDVMTFGLETSAQSVAVIDAASGALLYAEAPDEVRAIGSITKLMTASVFLDMHPDLSSWVTLVPEDFAGGGRAYLGYRDAVKLGDVLSTSLIGSDNTATMALVRFSGLSTEDFVRKMNEKAREWGLTHTSFTDPSGLSAANVSTAREVSVLLARASVYQDIATRTTLSQKTIVQASGFQVTVSTTNDLLTSTFVGSGYPLLAGKTGYIPQAGYCVTAAFNHEQHPIFVTILGAEDIDDRFTDAANVADWVYAAYTWPENTAL